MTGSGKMTDEVMAAARAVARRTGVDAAALLAVALVETNGIAFAAFDGRREPLIRFEGHYFDRLLPVSKKAAARAAGLSHPKAGRIRNPAAQSARWRLLDRAAAIDPNAAAASVSWGLGQVMGAHWQALGFAEPQALAAEARRSADGQLGLVAAFLKHERLDALLPNGAFDAFARRYNGPGYAANAYDAKIAAAFRAARARLAATPEQARVGVPTDTATSGFRLGARGEAVAALQRELVVAGYALVVDGIFGPRTASALASHAAGLPPASIEVRPSRQEAVTTSEP